jgi:hypothetical protein
MSFIIYLLPCLLHELERETPYHSLKEIEVDLRESAKHYVIKTIKDCHSRKIPCVKFITGRENHINSTEEREVLYEAFPSWMLDTEIKHLIEHCRKYDGYYLVFLDFKSAPSLFKLISRLLLLLLLYFLSLFVLFYVINTI